jgi:vitamin B12 transporter
MSQETCQKRYIVPDFRRKNRKQRQGYSFISLQVIFSSWLRNAFYATIGFSVSGNLMAQKDSVMLAPVVVKGFVPERFMGGLKIQKIDSATLATFRFQNIADLLSFNSPIAFKNYGPGQLNTASFRGTSANHTAVLWNGLNINSPTLGQTDFSTVPVAGFDQMSVQFGSAASIVGTDAVGGSILLGSTAPANGTNITLARQQESFNNNQTQIITRYGSLLKNGVQLSGKTALYDSRMNNHFPYSERRGYSILPSETFQRGFIQDLFLKIKPDRQLSAHIWLTDNDLVKAPANIPGRERTRTASYRGMIRYEIQDWTMRLSWVRDILDYATGDYSNEDHAVTDRFTGRVERAFQHNLGAGRSIHVLAGTEYSLYRTRVAGYEKALIEENRGDVFLLTRLQATDRWLVSVNLRQGFVTRYNPPFTPSLGTEYQLIRNTKHALKFRGSVGKSYRVPTLNERYWKNLGNPNIRPEHGLNKEVGLDETFTLNNRHSFTASVTGYHNRIKDWTYWNPSQNYRVENLQQVLARGIESRVGWNYQSGVWKTGLNIGYALTKTAQEKVYDAYSQDIIGKQLIYVPVHNGNLSGYISYKSTRLSTQMSAASKRFATADNSTFLDGYPLVNLVAETSLLWNKVNFRIQGRVNNLSDSFYLNVMNNAMPGRSFAIGLLISYEDH